MPRPRKKPAGKRGGRSSRPRLFPMRRRFCRFCEDHQNYIDYKDVKLLQSFIPERAKILPRRLSGVCARHQRSLKVAIKRARNLALLPYTLE